MAYEKFSSTLHYYNLIFSVKENNLDKFKTSLPYVKDVNIMHLGLPLIMHASDNIDMVRLLIEHKADVQSVDVRYVENLEVIEYLASKGLSLDRADSHGNTDLITSAGHRAYTRVEALLKCGADVHWKNYDGESALKRAEGDDTMEDVVLRAAKTIDDCDLFIEEIIAPKNHLGHSLMVENNYSELHVKILAIKEQLLLASELDSRLYKKVNKL